MPPLKGKVPSYCLHKRSGRAVVRLNGKDHYLGEYGSPSSQEEYQRLIQVWLATNNAHAAKKAERVRLKDPAIQIETITLLYRDFAAGYYVKNDKPTKEFVEMGLALRPVRLLFGNTPAVEFGPLRLKAVREHMIDVMDLSRGVINNRINRVKRFFRWSVAEELVPPSIIHGLEAVPGLRRGRTRARETDPVMPVDDAHVEAVLPHVTPHVAAMIQIQRMTGMRPGEVVSIRGDEIKVQGSVWIYQPLEHKNDYRGHLRKIPLGPKAQAILKPFVGEAGFLFSPKASEAWRNEQRRKERRSPMTPSQRKRKPKKKPKRAKRDQYDTASYRRAIKYGIKKVNRLRAANDEPPIPDWYPLQLRHSRATELNELYGICLLYTSPSPRDATLSRMPSSA